MPIHYILRENPLTPNPNDYYAAVQPIGTLDLEALIERMVNRGSTVTKEDALATLQAHYQTIIEVVCEGYNVVTPTVNYSASIRGVFEEQADSYDASRHTLEAQTHPGKALRPAVRHTATSKIKGGAVIPNPIEFFDFGSDSPNSVLTPGNGGRLVGHRLKIDPADPEQGVFFVAGDGTAVRAETLMSNRPAELIFLIPPLANGEYTVQVRARFGQALRTGSLPHAVTVTAT